MISLMERPLRKWHVSVTLFAAMLAPTLSIQFHSVKFPFSLSLLLFLLSHFAFLFYSLPYYCSLCPSLSFFLSFALHGSFISPPLITLIYWHFFSITPQFSSFSLHLSSSPFLSLWGEKHCFPHTKTLLLSGNYRQRLITTLGSNDAAPNEIFIKDPSASN